MIDVVEQGLAPFSSGARSCGFDLEPRASYDAWSAYLTQAHQIHESSRWWIGDLLNYGEESWPEEFSQAIPDQYTPKTLMDIARVARLTPRQEREDYDGRLSWSHHRAVANLPEEQRRQLLDEAVRLGLGVDALRALKKELEDKPEPQVSDPLDGAIEATTAWSGTVVVKGPIVVDDDATLTIEGGTRVHFV